MHDCFLYNIRIASVYLTPFNKLQGAKTSFRVKQIIDASQTACLHPEQFFWQAMPAASVAELWIDREGAETLAAALWA